MQQILVKLQRPFTLSNPNALPGQRIKVTMQRVERGEEVQVNQSAFVEGKIEVGKTYLIRVRPYMTKPSTPEFNFHEKFNHNIPMPFCVMQAKILSETPGMYAAKCVAVPMKTDSCIRCGRPLTHPVSRLYGLGPECGQHFYINPFSTEEELKNNLDKLRKTLSEITWEGYIIKKSIQKFKEV